MKSASIKQHHEARSLGSFSLSNDDCISFVNHKVKAWEEKITSMEHTNNDKTLKYDVGVECEEGRNDEDDIIWLCDHCRVAEFDSRAQAIAHEVTCSLHVHRNGILLSPNAKKDRSDSLKSGEKKTRKENSRGRKLRSISPFRKGKKGISPSKLRKAVRSVLHKSNKSTALDSSICSKIREDATEDYSVSSYSSSMFESKDSWKRLSGKSLISSLCGTETTDELTNFSEEDGEHSIVLKSLASSISNSFHENERREQLEEGVEVQADFSKRNYCCSEGKAERNISETISVSSPKIEKPTENRQKRESISGKKLHTHKGLKPRLTPEEMVRQLHVGSFSAEAVRYLREKQTGMVDPRKSKKAYFSAVTKSMLPDHYASYVSQCMETFEKNIGVSELFS